MWRYIQGVLIKLAFDTGEADSWRFLGIPKLESAEPDRNLINGRADLFKDFAADVEQTITVLMEPEAPETSTVKMFKKLYTTIFRNIQQLLADDVSKVMDKQEAETRAKKVSARMEPSFQPLNFSDQGQRIFCKFSNAFVAHR